MDLARFETLVAAYGATPNRWPAEERDAAQAFAHADARAAALLAEADAIDALLFAHRAPEPSRTLRAAVIESATKRRRPLRGPRLWWSGIALALAAGGGMLAGSAATAALEPVTANVMLYDHEDAPAAADTAEEAVQ
jgi:anti-sigma factor RsiW